MDIKIPLNKDIKVLIDPGRAGEIRQKYDMDKLDTQQGKVNVIFPDHILAVATAFTNPLFSKSVEHLGNVEAVFKKYNIVAPAEIKQEIKEKIALLEFKRL